mmetsp:Transcript_69225/g.150647  ORF Transcript_69225/g.150647 Transcript_69225/m.150647 type:complete len:103 (+) Transcript_69225:1118-1426(+)
MVLLARRDGQCRRWRQPGSRLDHLQEPRVPSHLVRRTGILEVMVEVQALRLRLRGVACGPLASKEALQARTLRRLPGPASISTGRGSATIWEVGGGSLSESR